jgi:hypothetical protein
MPYRSLRGGTACVATVLLLMLSGRATAQAQTTYPDVRGQWTAIGGSVKFVPDRPRGRGQEAPLTPEYQAIFEDNLKDVAEGGQGTDPTTWCLSPGMPRVTNGYGEIEFVITPETFHVLVFTFSTAVAYSPTDATFRPIWRRPSSGFPSAAGSIPRAPAATMCWRWRPAT